jgi:nitrite reductase/ring-hydroxylating ferredoxin subunit
MVGLGMFMVIGFHVAAAIKQSKTDAASERNATIEAILEVPEGFVYACEWAEIANNKAKMLLIGKENIALFRYEDKISAVHNVCKHQNGPLSEGRIIDGCITCPWHGYQYLPENGQSPPPFTEKLATYDVFVKGTSVYVHPSPYPEGTQRIPAEI